MVFVVEILVEDLFIFFYISYLLIIIFIFCNIFDIYIFIFYIYIYTFIYTFVKKVVNILHLFPHQTQPGGGPQRGGGGTPLSSTWYAAVGVPLAFTQEDFLVFVIFLENIRYLPKQAGCCNTESVNGRFLFKIGWNSLLGLIVTWHLHGCRQSNEQKTEKEPIPHLSNTRVWWIFMKIFAAFTQNPCALRTGIQDLAKAELVNPHPLSPLI